MVSYVIYNTKKVAYTILSAPLCIISSDSNDIILASLVIWHNTSGSEVAYNMEGVYMIHNVSIFVAHLG